MFALDPTLTGVLGVFLVASFASTLVPRAVARVAVFRVGRPRDLPLTDAVRRALTPTVTGTGTYRSADRGGVDLSPLLEGGDVRRDNATLSFDAKRSRVIARKSNANFGGAGVIVRVDLAADDGRLMLAARAIEPSTFAMVAVFAVVIAVRRLSVVESPQWPCGGAALIAWTEYRAHTAARELFVAVVAEVEARIAALAAAVP